MSGRQKYATKGRGGKSSGNSGISTLSTLMLGLAFISLVIFLVAPHDKSYAEEGKALLQRGQQLESEAIHMLFDNDKTSYLRGKNGHGDKEGHKPVQAQSTSTVLVKDTKSTSEKKAKPMNDAVLPNKIEDIRKLARHKYAYVTLMSGIDESRRYRGFLYNAMIMKKALDDAGSQADFIVMVGYSDDENIEAYEKDMDMLRARGILIHTLPRWTHQQHDLTFAEMALLKITPWSFVQYEKVQFFDGDVMPTRNMDCLFQLDKNSFTAGAVSALNSGWYLAVPNQQDFDYLREKAIWRLGRDWNKETGWNERMPPGLVVRGGRPASLLWDFNGADMDQGLLLHHHVINKGNSMLIDTQTKRAMIFGSGGLAQKNVFKGIDVQDALKCCGGTLPTSMFAHFTGRSKPWMYNNDNEKNRLQYEKVKGRGDTKKWFALLDSLGIPGVNSETIGDMHLGSPLGFWNHNFPKGGMTTVDRSKNKNG